MKCEQQKAEFDMIADSYYVEHSKNIQITGEGPEYFSRYKVKDFRGIFDENKMPIEILDFGSGIGNSIKYFREYFSESAVNCADVSERSMEIAKTRFPGQEKYIKIAENIPVRDESYDAIFTACVFHHIPHSEHDKWFSELHRVLRKGGVLVIYEHNPLNPLTVKAVNSCPIDINAKLIRASGMKKKLEEAGWRGVQIEYKLFFPSFLRSFRWLEKYLRKFFIGAQWRIVASK